MVRVCCDYDFEAVDQCWLERACESAVGAVEENLHIMCVYVCMKNIVWAVNEILQVMYVYVFVCIKNIVGEVEEILLSCVCAFLCACVYKVHCGGSGGETADHVCVCACVCV